MSVAALKERRPDSAILSRSVVQSAAEMFGALADPTRLKLLCTLAQGEMCVGELASSLEVSPSAVSHQLRGLRALRLVKFRRDGKLIYYSLDDQHVLELLSVALAHVYEANGHRPEP